MVFETVVWALCPIKEGISLDLGYVLGSNLGDGLLRLLSSNSEVFLHSFLHRNMWHFLSKFKLNYLLKMCGYPQFSFWILIAPAKICFFHTDKPCKNTVALVGKY